MAHVQNATDADRPDLPKWHGRLARVPYVLLLLVLICLFCCPAAAEISSCLSGYYRPGKYMSLRIDVDHASSSISIAGEGIVESRLPAGSRHTQAILPILVTGPIRQLRCETGGSSSAIDIPWRPLASNERLVGLSTLDKPIVNKLYRALFDDNRVESIRLDTSDPLPGPAVAWQTLDAVILGSGDRLDDAKMRTLLAGGTIFAIRSEHAPDARWPWRRIDVPTDSPGSAPATFWVLRPELRGPRLAEVSLDAFRTAIDADWPAAYRLRIILYAAAFAIVILLTALWRSRWAAATAVAISLVTVASLALWWRGRAPVRLRTATVIVQREGTCQKDDWTYRTSLGRGADHAEFADFTLPLFSPEAGPPAHLTLVCREDGAPAEFVYDTGPGGSIAFLTRSVAPKVELPPESPLDNWLLTELVKDAYRPRESWHVYRLVPASQSAVREDLGAVLIDAR